MLEIDTDPLLQDRIQGKVLSIKKLLNENNIKYENFNILPNKIIFNIENEEIKTFEKLLFSKKNNLVNSYLDKYNVFELDFTNKNGQVEVYYSKFGILSINNSALKQSIEIVRRRIDDVGTKEPTILQRGDKRILVELPGIKDPDRIKKLIGKTAQLNFRLVTNKNSEYGVDKLNTETIETKK